MTEVTLSQSRSRDAALGLLALKRELFPAGTESLNAIVGGNEPDVTLPQPFRRIERYWGETGNQAARPRLTQLGQPP